MLTGLASSPPGQVSLVFGREIQAYTRALCQGCYDYLERLPDPLLLRILAYLELEDVGRLGQTSHRFRKLCGSEEFWEQAVRGRWETVSAEVRALATEVGWRQVFFTSKLQLQKLISRRRQNRVEPQLRVEEEEQVEEEHEKEEEEEEEGLIPQASGTPEEFWDCAGSSGTNLNPGTGDSFDTESYSDNDSLFDSGLQESGFGSSVADTWP
ncbi:F-box only protein 36 [Merluccius polli]|uniref:F-box only protein 36 n=1 Tax=Merluccius polli TaxID=89951 RepID=A0AA47M4W0_MERPO|nr:F-box only protein 36 [Merluccius polli]